jgi:hypothetical protein
VDKSVFVPLLAAWGIALAPLIYVTFRRPASGFVASYCFQMWMFYWLGALVHSFPWSDLPDSDAVADGFRQATFGILAFAAGVLLLGPALGKAILHKQGTDGESSVDPRMPRKYITAGLISYFVLAPTIGRIPGLNAVPMIGSQLIIVGLCLRCCLAWRRSGNAGLVKALIPTFIIPAVLLVREGFMSYGIILISTIFIFAAKYFRPRWILAVGFVTCAYMGLTLYVSYMKDRTEIRDAVWGGQSISDRFSAISKMKDNFGFFSPQDNEQLEVIDGRLNQNGIVGAAVAHLEDTSDYMHGATIIDAVLAMVPRLLWPNKPINAGSGLLVSKLTGIEFGAATSVGIGPVLEFYGNFGTIGVLAGFFVLGVVIRGLDYAAGVHLQTGNWLEFMATFLFGMSCLNVSGSLVETTAAAAASVVVAKTVKRLLKRAIDAPIPAVEALA